MCLLENDHSLYKYIYFLIYVAFKYIRTIEKKLGKS